MSRSEYNIAPDASDNQIDDFLRSRLAKEQIALSSLETEVGSLRLPCAVCDPNRDFDCIS